MRRFFNSLSIRATSIIILLLAMTVLVGVVSVGAISYRDAISRTTNVFERFAYHRETLAQVENNFKWQIQEWKNTLLRGIDEQQFHSHLSMYYEAERETVSALQDLKSEAENTETINELIDEFIVEHVRLGKSYRNALRLFNSTGNPDSFIADSSVRGLENPLWKKLDEILTEIDALKESELAKLKSELIVSERILIVFVMLVILATILVILLVFHVRIIRPLAAAGALAERISGGDLSHGPTISRNDELGRLLLSLNNMRTRLAVTRDGLLAAKESAVQAMLTAESANRAKTHIMANMSHELRTPLNAIIGFSGALKEETFGSVGNEKNRQYLDDIYVSGQHLLGLINDILDASAIEAGALELHEENVSLVDVVESSIRLIRPRAEEALVTVTSSLDPEIPLIYADQRRVKQVMLNLLSNAVKFTAKEGEVYVSSWLNDDCSLSVAVDDTGVGMNSQEIKEALSMFGQVDSGLNRKYEGTGLGLPLTRGLMKLHGGTLEIKSKKGNGTLVTVTFPKERALLNA